MSLLFFFFKQKTAYEMRISDWSSDVCSSDLGMSQPGLAAAERADDVGQWPDIGQFEPFAAPGPGQVEGDGGRHGLRHQPGQRADGGGKIGRASCRERVCQYV